MKPKSAWPKALSLAAMLAAVAPAAVLAQPMPVGTTGLTIDQVIVQYGPPSEGRGAPVPEPSLQTITRMDAAALDGAVPEGIEPLERTIFTTDDFYADRDLWTDPRYWHCISSHGLDTMREADNLIGANFPETVAWGYCDRDVPREQIVSPYPYETAQEHYEALMAEAESRGGPTIHTGETLPDWDGVYARTGFGVGERTESWFGASTLQMPTYLSLLTPEYQTRLVQQAYHNVVSNAPQWPGAYCWPQGYTRKWFGTQKHIALTPDNAIFFQASIESLMTFVNIGAEFNMEGTVPRLGDDVRRWYGETIGFWDGDILISWTSNVQGWIDHGRHEFSSELQAIEIYTPITDADGNHVGINHEAVIYDPVGLVEPIRVVNNWEWGRALNEGTPFDARQCVQTLFPVDGIQTPVSPGDTIDFTVPDMFNRPWAQIWERYFEEGMSRPEEDDALFGF